MALSENGIKLLDIVVKGGFGTLIAAGVAYYGTLQHETIQRQQDDNRHLQSTIELSSHQKEFDVDLGMRLFRYPDRLYFANDTLRRPHATAATVGTLVPGGHELRGLPWTSNRCMRTWIRRLRILPHGNRSGVSHAKYPFAKPSE
jgi:hypothetical protein